MALIALVVVPLLAAFLCWLPPIRKIAWPATVLCQCIEFALALMVSSGVIAHGRVIGVPGWFETDGLGALVILVVSFVCAVAAIFSGGYMSRGGEQEDRLWWFYAIYNLFVFSLVVVPALAEPNLVWVGVELVTLFSVLLVGYENTAEALEAAWKFSVLTIMGAPIALLGFLVLFWAYRSGVGAHPETWQALHAAGASMSPALLKLSFLLVFVGFGAKTGLAPMHTWLPDAHSQAPTPICAVLSGVKTTVPFYVILRLLGILFRQSDVRMGRFMILIGLVSVGVAAFLLLQVRDYKRMFAYSTVEHMGIVLTAAGMATQASDFGAMSQLLNHAITKSLCFYVAGMVLLATGTREIKSVRGLLRISPFAGAALLFCSLAIAGAPPFPIFLSEFSILAAGIRARHPLVVGILASLIVIAFVGLMMHTNRMVFGRPAEPQERVAVPLTCRLAIIVAAIPVAVLGVYIPAPLYHLLTLAAQQLGGR
jgi:hydrogenase-4 component F